MRGGGEGAGTHWPTGEQKRVCNLDVHIGQEFGEKGTRIAAALNVFEVEIDQVTKSTPVPPVGCERRFLGLFNSLKRDFSLLDILDIAQC